MTAPTAVASRSERLQKLTDYTFDVVVIGGGVTGAGAARDAALRQLRVALLEKDDFGSGTSSRSSRLIHGGLRYLEQGHLRLVFESCSERRLLLKIAPHLVRPLAFSWPVYQGSRIPRWKLAAGLTAYDVLSLFRNVESHEGLSRDELLAREPALKSEGLQGGARYYDAATDDARLALANAIGAAEAGAVVLNHAAVRGLVSESGKVRGVRMGDGATGREFRVSAKVVVNATGPWTDEIRRMEDPRAPAAVRGSKGVHVAVPRQRLGNHEAVALLSPVDGRVFFVLPAGPHAVIGTTETTTSAGPDEVRATTADVQYLLDSANAFFPAAKLTPDDVIAAWAGIRPLVSSGYRGNEGANTASREHAVEVSSSGVVGITGGKLTTYRIMAADVVNAVEKLLGIPHRKPSTRYVPLPGGELVSFEEEMRQALEALGKAGTPARAGWLVHAHGRRWRDVVALAGERPERMLPIVEGLPYLRAEAAFAARNELAESLADVLVRRTKIAFQTRDNGVGAAADVAAVMGQVLGWSERDQDEQVRTYEAEAKRLFGIDGAESEGDPHGDTRRAAS